jgi:K+-sensing histidine kinase KdpD
MYKDIVVGIDENDGRESTIRAAAHLASASDAYLIGLYVRSRHLPALGSYGYISDEIAKNIKNQEDGHEVKAKE